MAIPKKQTVTARKQHLASLEKPPPPQLNDIRSGTWLNQQTFPDLEFAVPGLITEGSNILVGPPKAGKSWLALGLALACAKGSDALGSIPLSNSRPVLMFALEDSDRRMQTRIRSLSGEAPAEFYYQTQVDPQKLLDIIAAWLYQHSERKPLVILDTLGKAMPPSNSNESAYQRDYRIGSDLKQSVDSYPGASLLIIHHNRKAESDDFVDSVSGTNGLAGSADTILVLNRQRHEDVATLNVTGRDVEEEQYSLVKEDSGQWILAGNSLAESANQVKSDKVRINLGDNSKAILDFIEEHGEVSTKECVEEFGNNARMYLTRLSKSKRIIAVRRGYYALPGAACS